MKRFSTALFVVFVLSIFVAGCGTAEEGDPRASQPNTAPSSTPGTTSGATKDVEGATPTPGANAGASGTGSTAATSATTG
jgi:hypothetical protein